MLAQETLQQQVLVAFRGVALLLADFWTQLHSVSPQRLHSLVQEVAVARHSALLLYSDLQEASPLLRHSYLTFQHQLFNGPPPP